MNGLAARRVRILVPYRMVGGRPVSESYGDPAFRAEVEGWFDELGLPCAWCPVVLDPGHPMSLAEVLSASETDSGRDLYFDLCDGSEEEGDGYPGPTVVRALEARGLRFTGADSGFYAVSTSKIETKTRLDAAGVPTARWAPLDAGSDPAEVVRAVGVPLMVKPDVSAASQGIRRGSRVESIDALAVALEAIGRERRWFAESFLEGREFTALVVGQGETVEVFPVVERAFHPLLPTSDRFLFQEVYDTYAPDQHLPWLNGGAFFLYRAVEPPLSRALEELSLEAFRALGGNGYARVDLRTDSVGTPRVLEVNANCGLGGAPDSSTGSICRIAGIPFSRVLRPILEHGWNRS